MKYEETKMQVIKKIMNGEIELVNLTPHPLNWVREEGVATLAPTGTIARIEIIETDLGGGFVSHEKGEIKDLPEPEEGKVFVVSGFVFAATERGDVIAPNTNKSIRDENGRIIGVPGFIIHD